MSSRPMRVFVVSMMIVAPVVLFAAPGPRIHRGPTSPKLFKERTVKQSAPKTSTASIATPAQGLDTKAAAEEDITPATRPTTQDEHAAYPSDN